MENKISDLHNIHIFLKVAVFLRNPVLCIILLFFFLVLCAYLRKFEIKLTQFIWDKWDSELIFRRAR